MNCWADYCDLFLFFQTHCELDSCLYDQLAYSVVNLFCLSYEVCDEEVKLILIHSYIQTIYWYSLRC